MAGGPLPTQTILWFHSMFKLYQMNTLKQVLVFGVMCFLYFLPTDDNGFQELSESAIFHAAVCWILEKVSSFGLSFPLMVISGCSRVKLAHQPVRRPWPCTNSIYLNWSWGYCFILIFSCHITWSSPCLLQLLRNLVLLNHFTVSYFTFALGNEWWCFWEEVQHFRIGYN